MEGENGFTVYLAFRRRVSSESIFFNGLEGFYGARLEGVCYLLSKSSISLLHPEFWQVSTHLVTPTAVLKLNSSFLFPLTKKGCYFRFRILANHLASFFFLHPVRRFPSDYYTDLCISPSLFIRSQNANICWLSLWPGFVTSATRNWPTFPIPPFNGQSLRPVNSNTEG